MTKKDERRGGVHLSGVDLTLDQIVSELARARGLAQKFGLAKLAATLEMAQAEAQAELDTGEERRSACE